MTQSSLFQYIIPTAGPDALEEQEVNDG